MTHSDHAVHLVLLIHGLWGSPAHLEAAKEEIQRCWASSESCAPAIGMTGDTQPGIESSGSGIESDDGGELVVLVAGGMASQLTYDGIDVCASRVAWELDEKIKSLERENKSVKSFSVTGYSLGGLVARYLVGLLQSRTPSFFDAHRAVSFATIATPHLGIPRYNTLLSASLCWMGSHLLSRTGEQLYVSDTYSEEDGRPLLEIMADPHYVFYDAMRRFDRIHILSNGVKDDTVPYPSSAIESADHFADWSQQGIVVESDADGILIGWESVTPHDGSANLTSRRPLVNLGTLPPFLRYRFPFNYIILLLFPIMLPLVILLLTARLSLDTRKSRRRLLELSKLSSNDIQSLDGDTIPHQSGFTSLGLSVELLRRSIQQLERRVESTAIDLGDGVNDSAISSGSKTTSPVRTQVILKASQLRMVHWLNTLPLRKIITWYPEVANSHAVIIVRDPAGFPLHNRGRGALRKWAQGVLGKDSDLHIM